MATTKKQRLFPCPWVGGLISGAGSAIGAGIQALTTPGLRKQRQSKQKYDAWYQQNITEKNMALENQYAIDAENRANAYNDPSAVRARLEAAGLNPMSMTQSSDGGIQGSISSAPSAGGGGSFSPHPMSIRPDFSGVADAVIKGRQQDKLLDAQKNLLEAQAVREYMDAGLSEQRAKDIVFRRENIAPLEIQNWKLRNATEEQTAIQLQINNSISKIRASTASEERQLELDKLRAEIDKLKQDKKFAEKNGEYISALTATENELRNPRKENINAHTENAREESKTLRELLPLKKDQIIADISSILTEIGVKETQLPKLRYETWRYINNLPTGDLNAWDIPWAILNGVASVANGFGSDIGVPDVDDRLNKNRERLLKSLRKKYNYSE